MKTFRIVSVLAIMMAGVFSAKAQDVITLKSGEEIKVKVTEISATEIKYKQFENLNGPTVVIEKAKVFAINYENGTREVINAASQQTTSVSSDKQQDNNAGGTFKGENFGWKLKEVPGASAKIENGYYKIRGERPELSPQPVQVDVFTNLPLDLQKDFKITVKFQVVELTGYSAFLILFSSSNIIFSLTENDWATLCGTPASEGSLKTSKGDNITLTIQKEKNNVSFYRNGSLLSTTKLKGKIVSTELTISVRNIVFSAEVRINEVSIEQ